MLNDEDLIKILKLYDEEGRDISGFADEVYNNFILPKWRSEAEFIIGLEWELQGILLYEGKAINVYFEFKYSKHAHRTGLNFYFDPDEDKLILFNVEDFVPLADEYYVRRVYGDAGNFEIASKAVSLHDLSKMLNGVNKYLYNYFSILVKDELYPFALFMPATHYYVGKKEVAPSDIVAKHVNVSFVNKKKYKLNPEDFRHFLSDPYFLEPKSGDFGPRYQIRVPYNFRSYVELKSVFEKVYLENIYKKFKHSGNFWIAEFIRNYVGDTVTDDLDLTGDVIAILNYFLDVGVRKFEHYIITEVLEKHYRRYGLMKEPELILYSKTGERLIMPGKLY